MQWRCAPRRCVQRCIARQSTRTKTLASVPRPLPRLVVASSLRRITTRSGCLAVAGSIGSLLRTTPVHWLWSPALTAGCLASRSVIRWARWSNRKPTKNCGHRSTWRSSPVTPATTCVVVTHVAAPRTVVRSRRTKHMSCGTPLSGTTPNRSCSASSAPCVTTLASTTAGRWSPHGCNCHLRIRTGPR